jgi:hypothetical protein
MLYVIAENTGVGFITHEDKFNFQIQGFISNLWVLDDNEFSKMWVIRNNGLEITKQAAQELLNNAYIKSVDPLTKLPIQQPIL